MELLVTTTKVGYIYVCKVGTVQLLGFKCAQACSIFTASLKITTMFITMFTKQAQVQLLYL